MAVVAASIALAPVAPRADAAAPQTVVREGGREGVRQADALALARQVRERQQSLSSLYRRADARDRALVGRTTVLARYGYTGDPDEVSAVLPLASYRLSAGFGLTGPLWKSTHTGQDFASFEGDQIVAVAAGVVTEVADAGSYGLRTIVTLPDGTEVWYCHQSAVSVEPGQKVDVADPIGNVGSTGNSTGPHVHLEIRPGGGDPIDPIDWLRAAGLDP